MNARPGDERKQLNTVIDMGIRLAALVFLLGWCLLILQPFVSFILWGIIIAVAIFPVYDRLKSKMKGRSGPPAFILTTAFLLVLLVPTILLAESLIDGISHLRDIYQQGQLQIPDATETVKDWPAVLKPVADWWVLASTDLQQAVKQYEEPIRKALGVTLAFAASTGLGIIQFLASIIIAGIILGYSDSGGTAVRKFFIRLAGEKGEHFATISSVTIQNVVKGILGVAAVQALMAGIGLFVAGVPLAGLWTLFALIFAIVQVGVGPVLIPAVVYVFSTGSPMTAWLFLIWSIITMVSDNILKPILLGRKAPVPMLVVFIGSIGGFIANGFMGMFLGPVLLSLGYTLYKDWVSEVEEAAPVVASEEPETTSPKT